MTVFDLVRPWVAWAAPQAVAIVRDNGFEAGGTSGESITYELLGRMVNHVGRELVHLLQTFGIDQSDARHFPPVVLALTDAFDFPDRILNSALGRADGNVYEQLLLTPLRKGDDLCVLSRVARWPVPHSRTGRWAR